MAAGYDPFATGPFATRVHTFEAHDTARGRIFPCDLWYPAQEDGRAEQPGARPLIVYSHASLGRRDAATYLCRHLASHGYAVAAMDHSEVVAPEMAGRDGETASERAARIDAIVAGRVPDVRFLLDHLLAGGAALDVAFDERRIGLVGHSFGGWTVLATPDVDPRPAAVVALAPGGSTQRLPGVLPLELRFAWSRDVPTLILTGEDDVLTPVAGVREVFERTPSSRRMLVLRRADHQHFVNAAEQQHEALRTADLPGDAAWIPAAMRPFAELCPAEHAHSFVRALALSHFDATLRGVTEAMQFLDGDVETALRARGIDAFAIAS